MKALLFCGAFYYVLFFFLIFFNMEMYENYSCIEGNIHFGIYDNIDVEYLDDVTVAKAYELIVAAQAKEPTLSQRLYVEKIALSIEFVAVCKDCLKGKVDNNRIDALLRKGRTLGIERISESLDWNRYRRLLLDGFVYENFANNPDFPKYYLCLPYHHVRENSSNGNCDETYLIKERGATIIVAPCSFDRGLVIEIRQT